MVLFFLDMRNLDDSFFKTSEDDEYSESLVALPGFGSQIASDHLQSHVKAGIVGDDQVRFVLKRLDVFLISRHHMHLVAVEHVIQVIASFHLVPDYSPLELDVVLGVDEDLQIEKFCKFRVIQHEDSLYHYDGGGGEGQHLRLFGGVVEGVFFAQDSFAVLDLAYIGGVLLKINAERRVKIVDSMRVDRLQMSGFVIVVLRDQANLTGLKAAQQTLQK